MSALFQSLRLRDVEFKNRIVVSPMCQYSSVDGFAEDWHLVHLGSRAVGGAGLVLSEAIAVEARGRISPGDLGIWDDRHVEMLTRISRFVRSQGAQFGVQLAHAGRKASTKRPWDGDGAVAEADGGWQPIAPTAIAFSTTYPNPREMTLEDIEIVVEAFRLAAQRALAAGCTVVEIHAAHGYLLHEFLSPLSNKRTDQYGGRLENRCRIIQDIVRAIRMVWPERLPLFLRISATDWAEGGWDIEQSIGLVNLLSGLGVDLIDTSSGGLVPHVKIPVGPLYQTNFAAQIRRETGVPTGAVGMIRTAEEAEQIVVDQSADLVFMAREFLRAPYWPITAAAELHAELAWPKQYERAKV